MTWFAVRTLPGAQQPKREYWTEDAERTRKGYRIRSGVSADYSAVELALKDAGFTYYMPVEFAVVRNRHKKGSYELRRFALLKGYLFVGDMEDRDWPRLTEVPGIRGVVASGGKAFSVNTMDLHRLRMYEARSRAEAEAKATSLSGAEDRLVREKRKFIARSARKKLFPGRDVKLIWGDKVGREATVQAWDDQDKVRIILKSLDDAPETITVPYEFLRAAS
jgi:transcription antitermination factor NusG